MVLASVGLRESDFGIQKLYLAFVLQLLGGQLL